VKIKATGASFIMALMLSAASAIIVAVASVGFWVYFKKNRH